MSPTGPSRWPVKVLPLSKSSTAASWAGLVRFSHWLCPSFPRIWHSITFLRAHGSFLYSCIHRVRTDSEEQKVCQNEPPPSTRGPTTYLCSQKWLQALNSVGTSPLVPEQSPVPAPRPNTHKTLFSPIIPITVFIFDLTECIVLILLQGLAVMAAWVCEVPYCLFF